MYAAGEGRLGTDEATFISILASQSFAQLQLVFEQYRQVSKRTIEQAIRSEMSGDLERAMLTISTFLYHHFVLKIQTWKELSSNVN